MTAGKLESYVAGRWQAGSAEGRQLVNPTTGEELGRIDATGVDCAGAMDYARSRGVAALQAMTFAERGTLLRGVADTLAANRDVYVEIARLNSGNTAQDAAIDIDGGIGTLKVYAGHGKKLGEATAIMEAGSVQLAREDVFRAGHIWTSRPGVGVHINAFNFPSWGMWEKVACSLLAGVPAIAKPASATAWLSHQMVRDVIAAGVLPEGALSLICGRGEGLLEALGPFDHLAFTGSADTALLMRNNQNILTRAPRLNIEADSVNATILGPDAKAGDAVFDLLVREVVKALSVKAGQLCTNIRRIFVPAEQMGDVRNAIAAKISALSVGDPALESVRVGPLINKAQQQAAFDGLAALAAETSVVSGGGAPKTLDGGDAERGAFVAPTLLVCADPAAARVVHETEVFGPAATLMACDGDAAEMAARGGGSLALSLFTNDADYAAETVRAAAPWHGRVLVVDEEVGKNSTGHGMVMPQCVHGGPGRAGGGEELGGLRGLRLYLQRSAVQGSPALLSRLAETSAEATL
jgi:3,4-dehydroadipyl-CoA semialdehyde dehydrogenase